MIQINLPFKHPQPTMPDSPLRERLRHLLKGELDFHGNNNNSPIHTWHAFPAKFPPQLASTFINELTLPEDIVFDPMMGSCTTLFEHIYTGIRRLDRNKRMMPARWNKSNNTGIEARMHEEYVIGFLKPEF